MWYITLVYSFGKKRESQGLVPNLFHPDSPHFIYHGTNVGILTVWNLSVHIVYLRTGKKPQSKLCDPPGTLCNGP